MFTAALLAALTTAAQASTDVPKQDEPFPAFRLPTIDGAEIVDLRDLRGRKVLLIDFASW